MLHQQLHISPSGRDQFFTAASANLVLQTDFADPQHANSSTLTSIQSSILSQADSSNMVIEGFAMLFGSHESLLLA